MFGKYFASTFSGSMVGAGPDVFAVWGYVIAHCRAGTVELNPRLLASVIGTTEDRVVMAIEYLCQPDGDSRNPAEAGRRLIREGQYQYGVVSHALYLGMRNDDARREYNRVKQQESRARRRDSPPSDAVNPQVVEPVSVKQVVTSVSHGQPLSAAVSRRVPQSAQAEA